LHVEDLSDILISLCSFLCIFEPFSHTVSTAKLTKKKGSQGSKWLASSFQRYWSGQPHFVPCNWKQFSSALACYNWSHNFGGGSFFLFLFSLHLSFYSTVSVLLANFAHVQFLSKPNTCNFVDPITEW